MNPNEKLLKIITNETKDSISSLEIVTPTLFASIFKQFAQEHKLQLDDESLLTQKLLENECSMLTTLQTETSKNVTLLGSSTSKAIDAIKLQDSLLLETVLKETQELKDEIEKLKKSIYLDTLTKTYNRKWLQDHYTKDDSFQSIRSGTLALIDVNYFKEINDTYGHVVGDKVLTYLAAEFLKLGYPVIRYGGDEFLIMFDGDVKTAQAKKTLMEIRENILKKKFKSIEKTFTVSFSFGLQAFDQGSSCVNILEAADRNMYEDKIAIKQRIKSI